MAKVKLLRPLDGKEIGDIVEYNAEDAEYLIGLGVVQKLIEKAPSETKQKVAAPENKAAK